MMKKNKCLPNFYHLNSPAGAKEIGKIKTVISTSILFKVKRQLIFLTLHHVTLFHLFSPRLYRLSCEGYLVSFLMQQAKIKHDMS